MRRPALVGGSQMSMGNVTRERAEFSLELSTEPVTSLDKLLA